MVWFKSLFYIFWAAVIERTLLTEYEDDRVRMLKKLE